jgi:hypothetical protein
MVETVVHPRARLALVATAALALVAGSAPAIGQPAGPERYATLPVASPDGRHIAFTRDLPDRRQELYVKG